MIQSMINTPEQNDLFSRDQLIRHQQLQTIYTVLFMSFSSGSLMCLSSYTVDLDLCRDEGSLLTRRHNGEHQRTLGCDAIRTMI